MDFRFIDDMERMVVLNNNPSKIGLMVAFGLGEEDFPELAPPILVRLADGTEEEWPSDQYHRATQDEIERAGLTLEALASEKDHTGEGREFNNLLITLALLDDFPD